MWFETIFSTGSLAISSFSLAAFFMFSIRTRVENSKTHRMTGFAVLSYAMTSHG